MREPFSRKYVCFVWIRLPHGFFSNLCVSGSLWLDINLFYTAGPLG
jgi:hypothetical protein